MFVQQLPPTLTAFVRASVEPSAPENFPGCDGWAQGAHGVLRTFPPYERQKSIPKYMPVM